MDALALVTLADRIGIVAFAISGVAVGRRAGMDLFGLATLGLVAAIGGGIVRDVLIGDVPRVFVRTDYLLYAAGAVAAAIAFGAAGRRLPVAILDVADAIGTGAFAATGALLATEAGLDWPAAVLLAILTATRSEE
ncbi:MAG: trimeric intracellular cation channel family protein, partial [Dehalococcoidia bacterium]